MSSSADSVAAFRKKHKFVFGFMGRPEPAKGLPLILEAFKSPLFERTGLIIAGVGRSNHTSQVQAFAEAHDNVYFAGRVPPEEYLVMIDASLVPTQWEEPFGRVAMEAMGGGIPVIASNLGGLPEVLESYSKAVLVDHPADPKEWVKAMDQVQVRGRLLANEQLRDISTSRVKCMDVARQYEDVYLRAIAVS